MCRSGRPARWNAGARFRSADLNSSAGAARLASRIPLPQAVQYALGYTYPFLSVTLVVTAANASTGTCTDVGTGLALPLAYFQKAPYPQAGGAYAGGTIAVSLVSTVAAYVLSIGNLTGASAAFNLTAAALSINATYAGGDLSR